MNQFLSSEFNALLSKEKVLGRHSVGRKVPWSYQSEGEEKEIGRSFVSVYSSGRGQQDGNTGLCLICEGNYLIQKSVEKIVSECVMVLP